VQKQRVVAVGRWIFGLFYFSTGIAIVLFTAFGIGKPPAQPNAVAEAFTQALTASRFMGPLLALVYIAGGGALLTARFAPLGVILLTPVVVTIFCFHLILTGSWIWGTLNLVWLAALAWTFRERYIPLWSPAALR